MHIKHGRRITVLEIGLHALPWVSLYYFSIQFTIMLKM